MSISGWFLKHFWNAPSAPQWPPRGASGDPRPAILVTRGQDRRICGLQFCVLASCFVGFVAWDRHKKIGKRDVALHFAILMSFPYLWRVFADLKFALWRDGVLARSLDILVRIQIVMQVLGLRDPFFQSYAPLFNRMRRCSIVLAKSFSLRGSYVWWAGINLVF